MSDKYKREIEEILEQAGEVTGRGLIRKHRPSLFRLVWMYVGRAMGGKSWAITPGRVMVAAVVVLLLTPVLRAGPIVGLVGLLLFIVGYAMFFVRPKNQVEKRWRGQPLDDGGADWWDRIRGKSK